MYFGISPSTGICQTFVIRWARGGLEKEVGSGKLVNPRHGSQLERRPSCLGQDICPLFFSHIQNVEFKNLQYVRYHVHYRQCCNEHNYKNETQPNNNTVGIYDSILLLKPSQGFRGLLQSSKQMEFLMLWLLIIKICTKS